MKAIITVLLNVLFTLINITGVFSPDIPLDNKPVWHQEEGNVPTGIGWADFNGDGRPDLFSANGLDGEAKPNAIYFTGPDGLATTPGLISDDTLLSCQIDIGDIDNDGTPDVAVASLGLYPTFKDDIQGIYLNKNGLSKTMDIHLPKTISFSCDLGDPDNDGDLDIAFAPGIFVTEDRRKVVVYANNNGQFDTIPWWQSDSVYYCVDVAFVDIDRDGDHDLAMGGREAGINIFYNHDGVLETVSSYHSDVINGGRQIAFGDMDGDGFLDLAAAGIKGGFVVYKNINGTLEEKPSWWCYSYQEPSCVAWGDVDGDGDLDLAAGIWYGLVGVFENDNGTLSQTYQWEYPIDGSCQQVVWYDYDEDKVVAASQTFTGDGRQKLFYVDNVPMHRLSIIKVDGKALSPDKYCHDRVDGWISLKNAPAPEAELTIEYSYSNDLDLTVSAGELYIFENTSAPR